MPGIPPIVKHMLVCRDVTQTGSPAPDVSAIGMVHTIRRGAGDGFPFRFSPGLCVYVVYTGGVGTGRVQVTVSDSGDERSLFGTPAFDLNHPPDRHTRHAVVFRLTKCIFPAAGLYWVEFRYDDMVVQRESLIVR